MTKSNHFFVAYVKSGLEPDLKGRCSVRRLKTVIGSFMEFKDCINTMMKFLCHVRNPVACTVVLLSLNTVLNTKRNQLSNTCIVFPF